MRTLVATSKGMDGLDGAVGPLAGGTGAVWAVVDGRDVWRGNGEWARVASAENHELTCIASAGDAVFVGTAEAHLLALHGDRLDLVESFDALAERASWYTPWGGPPDTRSIAIDGDEVLVNIHVGGVAKGDADRGWRALVDIDVDVHQIVVAPDGSLLIATGAAGFGRSTDGGDSWTFDADGLHGSYCRAVAVAGDTVLLTASTGPHGSRGAVYRRPLGATGAWARTTDLFDGNIDTFWLAAEGDEAAFVTEDGDLWRSGDAGATWDRTGEGYAGPRAVTLVD